MKSYENPYTLTFGIKPDQIYTLYVKYHKNAPYFGA